MADFQINVVLGGAEKVVSTVGDIQRALKQTREELKGVEVGSAAFEKLTEQARKLQRELKDVKESTNFEQNIAQSVEAVSRLGSTVASSFAVASAAFSLFGDKTDEISKAQVKAQQAITIAIGATTIAANANRLAEDARNAGLLIQNGIIKLITLATGAKTAATVAETGATEGATIAQLALNAAMKANPILLLVGLLATAVTAYIAFSDSSEEAAEAQKKLNEQLEKNASIIRDQADLINNYNDQTVALAKAQGKSAKEIYDLEVENTKTRIELIQRENAERRSVTQQTAKELANAEFKLKILKANFDADEKKRGEEATKENKRQIEQRKKDEEGFEKFREETRKKFLSKLLEAQQQARLSAAQDEFETLRLQGKFELDALKANTAEQVAEIKKKNDEFINSGKFSSAQIKLIRQQEAKDIQDIETISNGIRIAINEQYANKRIALENKIVEEAKTTDKQRLADQEQLLADLEAKRLQTEANIAEGEAKIVAEGKVKIKAIEVASAQELKDAKEKFAGDPRLKDIEKEIIERKNAEIALAEKATADQITAYKIAKLQEYAQVASQIANSILGIASAITEGEKIESENRLRASRDAAVEQTNSLNAEYQNQVIALQQQKQQGLITEQQYNQSVKTLDKNLAKSKTDLEKKQRAEELKEKKKAFETDKKLKIAQAIISGAQGAVSAFTGAMQLGPIAGPIVGGILAAAVVAATAIQVANIQKTQFDAGPPDIQEPQIPDATTAAGGGGTSQTPAAMPTPASTGGFTGFAPGLVGGGQAPSTGGNTSPASPGGPIKVVVLESDITSAQRRVSVAEANATF